MTLSKLYQLYSGVVSEVLYSDSNPDLLYGVKVNLLDEAGFSGTDSSLTAVPLNPNMFRTPIEGEVVLVISAPSSDSFGLGTEPRIYYIDIVGLQTDTHHNSIPTVSEIKSQAGQTNGNANNYSQASAGITTQETTPTVDKNFTELDTVRPLQHYVGDVMISGRYGQSIRFSTTPKSGKFSVNPKWSKGDKGAPITIIRNTKQDKKGTKINEFVTEDFTKEDNVIVMSSGQNIDFEQYSGVTTSMDAERLTSWKTENWGQTPQCLISSGRIVFNSTQKEIVAFAKKGIALSSASSLTIDAKSKVSINGQRIDLGTNATEPLILGNQWNAWMTNLINAVGTITPISPVGPCSPLIGTPQWAAIAGLLAQIPTLLSGVAYTKKAPQVTVGKSK